MQDSSRRKGKNHLFQEEVRAVVRVAIEHMGILIAETT
jgi:hypothetical protein